MNARRRASRRECASRTLAIDCTGDIRVHEATHSRRIFGGVFSRSILLASASVAFLSDGLMRNTRTTLAPAVTNSGSSAHVNLKVDEEIMSPILENIPSSTV